MPALTASPIGVETLDDPAADPALVDRMLGDIARANRWFGGVPVVRRGLAVLLDDGDRGKRLTLLDVGTGAGDLPLAAVAWAAQRDITLTPIGVERHRAAARLATTNGVSSVVACGGALPWGNGAVDLVLLSQLLHHFDDDAAIMLLREATRVARCGVIVADLRPSRLAALGFRAAGRLLHFERATVDDGVISLARGRDASALTALARRAGAAGVVARDLPMARVLAAWHSHH